MVETKPETIDIVNSEKDSTLDSHYFNEIYRQEKLISADDAKILSITDSLFSKDTNNQRFYFIVFTKSMNGADGFYSEAVGLSAYDYVTTRTKQFADFFSRDPKLTQQDLENWGDNILGEIQISKEHEVPSEAARLEKLLLSKIEPADTKRRTIIEQLIERIKSTAHNRS